MLPPGYGQVRASDGPRVSNNNVAHRWALGLPAKSGTMSTDGQDIYSYLLKIGYTDGHGKKIATRYQGLHSVSNTTSHHVSLVMRVSDIIHEPAGSGVKEAGLTWG